MNHIRYVDHNAKHSSDFVFEQPNGHDCWLLLLTHTPAEFMCEGRMEKFPENSVILYAPGTHINYRACAGYYENDWLRFDSDELYVSTLPVQGRPFSVSDPEYIHNLFCLLTWEHNYPGNESEMVIDNLLRVLFSKLHDATSKYGEEFAQNHYYDLLNLRKSIVNNPQYPWRISEMANRLHLSEGYVQVIYQKAFGVSCMDDVINARLRLAEDQLRYTEKSIAQIAEFCGYNNIEHFCRQFRRFTGKSPREYRKNILR